MRIAKDGITVNPDVAVDDAARHVLAALEAHIKHLVGKAVEAEREACADLCDDIARNFNDPSASACAYQIRAKCVGLSDANGRPRT